MTTSDWNENFGDNFLFTLTNEERRYLALCATSPDWESIQYYSKTNLWYTRTTAFFDGDTIVKVISETKKVLTDGSIAYEGYVEYDTALATAERRQLLPLTSRGKPKNLTASNIEAVTPFGCRFTAICKSEKGTSFYLNNPRANREFPIGEWDAISKILREDDFHAFMDNYIATCREDYFDKLQAFKTAKKVTIKYKPGDIFRMELDRTHYTYGLITGEIKKLKAMPELPKKHSFRSLMMMPIMIRPYQMITENPNLKADDLRHIPLDRVDICGDNDIIWGTHTIVDHKQLEPDDMEFNFVCSKIISHTPHTTIFTQDMLMHDGIIPKQEYSLYIEWGFAQTELTYDQLSDKLKDLLSDYSSPHAGVSISINPRLAVSSERIHHYDYRNNLLNSDNREILNEIFACLELDSDTTFDQFAEKFGGLSMPEIISRMT